MGKSSIAEKPQQIDGGTQAEQTLLTPASITASVCSSTPVEMSRRSDSVNDPRATDSDDNEFGEFEGFEGAVGGVVAHPTPSPWATFPDLVRVRTSPGSATNNGGNGTSPHSEGQGDNPPSSRSRNPPDVSLHSRESNSSNDDVNLLNFIPSSHQRVGGTLPDMAVESELRHTMQQASSVSSSPAPRDHIAQVRPTLRGSTHDGPSLRNVVITADQPGTLASIAANVQRTSGLPRSNRTCGGQRDGSPPTRHRDWGPEPDTAMSAALRESNAALSRSEARVRELESQLRDLRERESRNERRSLEIVNELQSIRDTLTSQERATRSLAERVQVATSDRTSLVAVSPAGERSDMAASDTQSRTSMEDRLASMEASLERLCAKVLSTPVASTHFGAAATATAATSPGLLTKEDVAQAVQEVLSRQSTQQKSLLEDERRRLMQSFAESFQVAISQFLQSLNSDNLDS